MYLDGEGACQKGIQAYIQRHIPDVAIETQGKQTKKGRGGDGGSMLDDVSQRGETERPKRSHGMVDLEL
jgi:hypothetical protein